ncbi:DUF5590 domain-containing protein [Paenibacillus agilis]|uniref:Cell wall elongation regulator TseB-like domain-containing protein n=1 Tax=Paenibacillus agilis TaxID=3020863 RepID=A0A559IZ96_9BACL|nr:DUF5590 domain-containing protein [Paenibacillus agilis]TVX92927.1 hypothetical protein FPZ44_07580 [Paenibacillus agilis]
MDLHMTRSRPRRRRNPRWRWVVSGIMLALVLVISLLVYFLNSVNREEDAKEAAAIQRANEAIQLISVDEVEKFVWYDTIFVIHGKDASNTDQIVWVGKEKVDVKRAADGVDKAFIADQILSSYLDAEIKQIKPGIKDGELVYQAFVYRKDEEGTKRHYYHFFRFDNGQRIGEGYPMPNQ